MPPPPPRHSRSVAGTWRRPAVGGAVARVRDGGRDRPGLRTHDRRRRHTPSFAPNLCATIAGTERAYGPARLYARRRTPMPAVLKKKVLVVDDSRTALLMSMT